MTLNQIKKFENLNDISINVYSNEEYNKILPLRLINRKRVKHVNLLYVEDTRDDNGAFFKDFMPCQLTTKKEHKKYFCDRYVYTFNKKKDINIFSNIFFYK